MCCYKMIHSTAFKQSRFPPKCSVVILLYCFPFFSLFYQSIIYDKSFFKKNQQPKVILIRKASAAAPMPAGAHGTMKTQTNEKQHY